MYSTLKKYPMRYIGRIIIEAQTPLSLSTGEKDVLTDSPIMKDVNGLPMIPGTSLAGVLRHNLAKAIGLTSDNTTNRNDISETFGWQNPKANNETQNGAGSRFIISNGHFVGKDGEVIESIQNIDWNDQFYKLYQALPIRQHTKINHKGVADTESNGKFDEQVVYKGTRFCFEMELIGNENDRDKWEKLLDLLYTKSFRVGGGTRKGFGAIKVVSVKEQTFNFNKSDGMKSYLAKSSSLNSSLPSPKIVNNNSQSIKSPKYIEYKLKLKPENFWMFGSGLCDSEADMTPVFEDIIEWKNNNPIIKKDQILIPATSIKGAISHRTAFHYNRIEGNFVNENEDINDFVGENNEAVSKLFGIAKDSTSEDINKQEGRKGKVIISDKFVAKQKGTEKILNHVTIDRFTGGAIDGALYDEKVLTQEIDLELDILVENIEDLNILEAFEQALKDICKGMLPLGGGTMRGHGCFIGKLEKNGKEIYNA